MISKLVLCAALAFCGAAQAKVVGQLIDGDTKISLLDEQQSCPNGLNRVVFTDAQDRLDGCWLEIHDRVFMFFELGFSHLAKSDFTFGAGE